MLLAANLARLLILIKKGGLLQLNTGGLGVNMHLLVGAITWKFFDVSFPNLLCLLLV